MTTTRAQGRKKSQFVAKTTVEAGGYFDYVVNGYNYRIAYTDFIGGLGVTGTIVQEGNVSGTPVLETVAVGNHKIRNLENGSGVKSNVSAGNGITLSHNFTVDATGSPLMLNTAATSPTFVSLLAGSGITLSAAGNVIAISANDDLAYAESYLQGNSTATVIASTATPVLIAGTWTFGVNTGFTQTSAGRFTYNGTTAAVMTIHASITLDPVSASNQNLSLYVAKNGAVISETRISASIAAGLTQNLALSTNQSFATNDYIDLFVQNSTTTDNILVASALFGID